ncbi:hypothetical protein [Streptomyces sp. NBC_00829]|nr:hypothetical protein OG293_15755 [Streptomyces sp. NBC_00829]
MKVRAAPGDLPSETMVRLTRYSVDSMTDSRLQMGIISASS